MSRLLTVNRFTTTAQGLVPAPGTAGGLFLRDDGTWASVPGGFVSPLTTKGDILGFDTVNNRIPVGADTLVLTADSTQPLGVKWAVAGTVTSVAFADGSGTAIYTVTGSPVTGSGTLTNTLKTQTANKIFAGPTSGGAAQPTFRSMVAADGFPGLASNVTKIVQAGGASQVYTIPVGSTMIRVYLISGGGGGGSGSKEASTAGSGGGGGGGGGVSFADFLSADLGASVTITFSNAATGGNGGAAVAANSTIGNAGVAGSDVQFGTFLFAYGGQAGGGGGSSVAGAAGSNTAPRGAGNISYGTPGAIGSIGTSGTAASAPNLIGAQVSFTSQFIACTGGGGGASINAGGVGQQGGAGGGPFATVANQMVTFTAAAGGAAGSATNQNGNNGTNGSAFGYLGIGSGGGGAGSAGNATTAVGVTSGSGGNGGGFGGGGGGGGAGFNPSSGANGQSGSGGNGGGAACICIAW